MSYLAPEVLRGSEKTAASDVYSYSMVMFEVITGTQPYSSLEQLQIADKVVSGERPAVTASSVSAGCALLVPLMQQCWHQDPTQRPSITSIVDELNIFLKKVQFEEQQVHMSARIGGGGSIEQQQLQRATSFDKSLSAQPIPEPQRPPTQRNLSYSITVSLQS